MKKTALSIKRVILKGMTVSLFLNVVQPVSAQSSVHQLSLNSSWEMRQVNTDRWQKAVVPGCVHTDLLRNNQIPDPFYRTNEKQLQWIDKKDWEYRTVFDLSDKQLSQEKIELVFKGLDTFADVYLNGKLILTADNMFREWVVDAKSSLNKGNNELRVYFHSPIGIGLNLFRENGFKLQASNDQSENGGLKKGELVSPYLRKAPYHFGWDWGPRLVTSGIWQPVFLRNWNNVRIDDFHLVQDSLSDKIAKISARVQLLSTKKQTAKVEIFSDKNLIATQTVELKEGENSLAIPCEIRNPIRWWTNGLGKPHLYALSAVVTASSSSDSETRKIGLRTLKLIQQPDSKGHSFYFELNGVPVFAKGENHIPNDMFADRVTKEVYDWEINTAVQSNLNMLRVWGGGIYEDDYFYDLCDEKGILVWQDFMFACSLYPGISKFLNSITAEANYQVKRLRNHPCIALWCGNNEIDVAFKYYNGSGWGWKKDYTPQQIEKVWSAYDTIFNHILPSSVAQLAPQTPYSHSSPATVIPRQHATDNNPDGDVHYWGVWWGKHPFEKYADNIGRFMSEYGFQSFPEMETIKKYALPSDYDIESEVMRHHQRSTIGNVTIKNYMDRYYKQPTNFENFIYVGQVLQAYGIQFAIESHRRAMPYNMGSLVWQINDCWPVASWSSSDYFHRWKALQYEIKRSFEPVIVSAWAKGDSTAVTIVSDRLQNETADLEINVNDFTGRSVKQWTKTIIIKANGVTPVFEELTSTLSTHPFDTYISFVLKSRGKIITQKCYFFTAPKNLNLLQTNIVSSVEAKGGVRIITLKSNHFAKNVFLNYPGIEGRFSDNYFDMEANKVYTVNFAPKGNSTIIPKLQIKSLIDSY